LRIGLIGCGGRGTGAAKQALKADPNVQLTAMADMFADRLELSLNTLTKQAEIAGKIEVPPERQYTGASGYQQLLADGVDVVLLATPPHFRPAHLAAAVEAGVHVFAEKPVAVDGPGVRAVLATCEKAHEKKLSLVSGLCLRYSYGFQETVRQIQDGRIGQVTTLYANDYRGTIWLKERQPDWTDMHYQMRNWYYYTWLSGDFNVEQHVHFLDVCAWAMGDRYPVKAVGMGGRQQRTGPEYGNIFDHHAVVYEYDDGARLISNTRQMKGCHSNMSAQVVGTKGNAGFRESRNGLTVSTDTEKWVYAGEDNDIYQTEHDRLFASIRSGQPINNGQYMAHSTLLAILGRMATYTGQEISWDQALNSQEDLTPPSYAWGPAPEVKIAIPGVTRFV
jgi:predicted dehydrogenase